jgi:hypothetical protein
VKYSWLKVFVLLALIVLPEPVLSEAAEVELNIRFYDKKIYFVVGAGTGGTSRISADPRVPQEPQVQPDPIYVQATIYNRGSASFHFKLAEERVFSVDFDVRNLANQSLNPADYLLRKRSESRNVFYRDITVEPGESFSFIEDIRNYADLSQPGSFVVQARIFPNLLRTVGEIPLESNRLTLNLRPPLLPGPDGIPFEMDVETNAVLAREKLPPDEVVRYMLDARIKSQWEKYFLYMDIPALLSRDAARRRSYLNESAEGRQRMETRYREDLRSAVVDGDIVNIPADYRIENTSYGSDTGTVVVTEWFRSGRITERRRYTYFLRLIDDFWLIQDYTPIILGTE